MASILPGYEYDIFISYRQKDNKGDRWVSEFVDALKDELEATFKEEISVYFDINPHDGLLETYDVNESLREKLKCLVFIPIISRTYCDPLSFAWEHEFKAFVEQASHDHYGLKIKLPNGNVASRVLPVQIHDLDKDDIKLCESVLGTILRGIEFIYKESGVNRPLMSNEDRPQDNLNNTIYRNQINKVANAVKEIITAIKKHEQKDVPVNFEPARAKPQYSIIKNVKFIVGFLVVTILAVGGYFLIPKLSESNEIIDKSIAVLPFKNLSKEQGNEFFADGLVEDLLNRITVIEELKVISNTSSEMFRERGVKSVPEIASQLGVSYIVEGSVQRYGDRARVTVQLIDAINDDHIWAENYDRDLVDIFKTQSEIALKIASELNTILTAGQKTSIQDSKTKNVMAFELYQMGRYHWNKRTGDGYAKSIEYFEKAIDEDPEYGLAYAGLADSYILMALQGWIDLMEGRDKAEEFALKALELNENLAEAYTVLGQIYDYVDWEWEKAEKAFKLSFEKNPNYVTAHHYYSEHLSIIGQHEEARKHIDKALELNPLSFIIRYVSGKLYYHRGSFTSALREIQKCKELNKDHPWLPYYEFRIYWQLGEEEKAYEALQKIFKRDSIYNLETAENIYQVSGLDAVIDWKIEIDMTRAENGNDFNRLAVLLGMVGKDEKALYWLEKAFELRECTEMPFNIAFENLHDNPGYIAILKKMGLAK